MADGHYPEEQGRAGAGDGAGAGSSASGGGRARPKLATEPSRSYQRRLCGRLFGKSAIVTGGGQGIGAAVVRRFVEEGCSHVAVFDVDEEASAALVEACTTLARRVHDEAVTRGAVSADDTEAGPPRVRFFRTNMASEEEVAASVNAVVEWAGAVHVLVNNAATFIFGEVQDVSEEAWDKVLAVNVKGYAFAMKHVFAAFKAAKGGSIVNLSSVTGFVAMKAVVPYCTTKGAIIQMTRCTALDMGKHGIRVNCVCPGPIHTAATTEHADREHKSVDELVESQFAGHLILKRLGACNEVADAVVFLASDDASYITATSLLVDGGYGSI